MITLNQVSLWRRTQEELTYDLKKTILSLLEGRYHRPVKHRILNDINLSILTGEKIGIIGANGSGKSTLLKVIVGILEPTLGSVKTHGRIAPLIELGAGFVGDLSVVNNILTYGVFLGVPLSTMRQRVSAILEFAELEAYAKTPVKALSSGMTARLGFAIATDVQPDILILDEVLSVGDERFKAKCQQRMQKLWQTQTTVVVVSHQMEFIQAACDRVIWLHQGQIQQVGPAQSVIEAYLATAREQQRYALN
ncbi:MAG: ABC transporter ATP-binding protein [Spirulina sp. SIO3F2]|nr:ABC transporter ATP-binding protein [Spirulina sp. SIO3F2]